MEGKLIFKKEYPGRKNVILEFSRKSMYRCSCGKLFKIKKGVLHCPKCGQKASNNKKDAITLEQREHYKFFNSYIVLFVDEIVKNGTPQTFATLSIFLSSVSRKQKSFFPKMYEHSARLKIRFNLTKRTAVMYINETDVKYEYIWDSIKLSNKFINFTQPTKKYYKSLIDISLPTELINDIVELINVDIPEEKKENIDLELLAWINRMRNFNDAERYRDILKILTRKYEDCNMFPMSYSEEELKNYKQALGRIKRYTKTFYKPKNFDEKTFDTLCRALGVERNQ